MVREFGLSSKLGPIEYPEGGSAFLGSGGPLSTIFSNSTRWSPTCNFPWPGHERRDGAFEVVSS
jgi:hypothetical protein